MARKKQETKGETPSAAKVMQERPCDECAVEGRGTTSGPCKDCSPEHDKFVAGHGARKTTELGKDKLFHEYADGMVQLNDGPIVKRETMVEAVKFVDAINEGRESMKAELEADKKKKPTQVDLEMNPVKEHIIEDEETIVAHYRFFRHGSFYLRIKDEALEKLLTQKKKESDEDFQDRVLSTVQKRVKISTDYPVGRDEYDEAWTQIFNRLFEI